MFYTYVLKSVKTGKFYIGYSSDIAKRIEKHNNGKSRSTKSGIPWSLYYFESYETKTEAIRRELEMKSWKSHKKLEQLLN
ncbi:MAG: GIY-YIG nuclease family protein [Bacteroidetes bacterium]|nr:GIY-YIG nuclease family protein [Bacteroidota bacterium]